MRFSWTKNFAGVRKPVDAGDDYPLPVALATGDIEIGAVELKDGATDTRAKIGASTAIVEADNAVAVKDANGGLSTDTTASLTRMGRLLKIISLLPTALMNNKLPVAIYGHSADTLADRYVGVSALGQMTVAPLITTAATDALANAYLAAAQNGTTGAQAVALMEYNGATHDRRRNNVEGTVIASAARTATNSSADQTNHNHRGVRVFINTSAIGVAPSTVFSIEVKDPISGVYTSILASVAIAATGHVILTVGPGLTAAANTVANMVLGRTWRVTATHGNGNSHTYSVGYQLLP